MMYKIIISVSKSFNLGKCTNYIGAYFLWSQYYNTIKCFVCILATPTFKLKMQIKIQILLLLLIILITYDKFVGFLR